MEAYKFETTVLENGVIQIPEISKYVNRPIEVFIVLKQADSVEERVIELFLEKWTGFLKDINPDDVKLKYLQDKYERRQT